MTNNAIQRVVKYCRKEHNILLGCTTIKLCSLNHYRDLDPNFSIADKNEGNETTIVANYDSQQAPSDAKALLNFGDGHIKMENCVVERHFPNSLVFCTSCDPGQNYMREAKKIDPDYNSYYLINDIYAFSSQLAHIIIENFEVAWFDETFRPQLDKFTVSDYKQIMLEFICKPISYVGRKKEIVLNNQLTQRPDVQSQLDRIVFTKESSYADNREYRSLFIFTHPRHGIIPVRKDPIILPISPLAKELQPIN